MNKKMSLVRKIGRFNVEITNPDRILFPADKITKRELIDYYLDIASYCLPWAKNHPMTMLRYPNGIKGEGFFQKNVGSYFPAWIKTVAIKHEASLVNYVVCNNAATLAYIANQACITPHLWLSRIDKLHIPDRMIFDLDPSGSNFDLVRKTAKDLRMLLEDELGLTAFVMTTGSRGFHIWVPLKRSLMFDVVHELAETIGQIIVKRYPKTATLAMPKVQRKGKVFIDYLRNSYSALAVMPYAVRAKPGAPIATPLHWDELNDSKLDPQKYTIKNIAKRLAKIDDPWANMAKIACSLKKAQKIVKELLGE